MDARIASFFFENGIALNVADSTSFISIIDESTKFAKQNPLQSYKTRLPILNFMAAIGAAAIFLKSVD